MLEMKRVHSNLAEKVDTLRYEDDGLLGQQPARVFANEPLTPPPSPERGDGPSKFRRHGSKLISVLRSLTNSGKQYDPTQHSQSL
jgi:protein-serine/threonine kinase